MHTCFGLLLVLIGCGDSMASQPSSLPATEPRGESAATERSSGTTEETSSSVFAEYDFAGGETRFIVTQPRGFRALALRNSRTRGLVMDGIGFYLPATEGRLDDAISIRIMPPMQRVTVGMPDAEWEDFGRMLREQRRRARHELVRGDSGQVRGVRLLTDATETEAGARDEIFFTEHFGLFLECSANTAALATLDSTCSEFSRDILRYTDAMAQGALLPSDGKFRAVPLIATPSRAQDGFGVTLGLPNDRIRLQIPPRLGPLAGGLRRSGVRDFSHLEAGFFLESDLETNDPGTHSLYIEIDPEGFGKPLDAATDRDWGDFSEFARRFLSRRGMAEVRCDAAVVREKRVVQCDFQVPASDRRPARVGRVLIAPTRFRSMGTLKIECLSTAAHQERMWQACENVLNP